jgi:uncharacterized damage-inducible protein DinB
MDNFSQKEFLLNEFNNEMKTTRKFLEKVPFDKFDWMPHEKSSKLGSLAIHVATLPGIAISILTQDSMEFGGKYEPPAVASTEDILALFEKTSGEVRSALEATTDEHLNTPWSFMVMGNKLFEGNRVTAFQQIMMNHVIHHRAQLGVYLRLNDIEIPGSYGPSADEKMN